VEAKNVQGGNIITPSSLQNQSAQHHQVTVQRQTIDQPVQPATAPTDNSYPPTVTPQSSAQTTVASPSSTQVRVVMSVEPTSFVGKTLNARLDLKHGAVIGRTTGDYLSVFAIQSYVSGTHARIQKNPNGRWEIVDLGSTNGTFLNRQRLTSHQPVSFKIGDEIAFCDTIFIVE
jgi:pSer/pThr/pTyr-binding forkhead associated (FHA) protein